ncbi:MAG: hypothetical protein VW576_08755 [Opitutae bacterium]
MKQPYLIALIFFAPFLSILGQDETLHPWTDTQGRTLQASFISLDEAAQTVTIKWNGQVFPLPLNTLAPQSQALAKQLGAPPPTTSTPTISSSPFDEILDEVIAEMPMDALGPEALDVEHDWTSADGRPLSAKFVSLVGDQLTVAMDGGAKEFTLPLSKFSVESQALAKVLQKVAQKHRPAPPKPAVSAKPVKVVPPKVVEADLEKTHTWTSADGRSLEASFVSADEKGVDLKIRGRSSPMSLEWSKLDAQSIALGQALQKLKKSLIPSILSGGEKVLARYGSGKWKGYNTYFESVAFEAGLHSNGQEVHVWLLDGDGNRVTKKIKGGSSAAPLPPMRIHFFPFNNVDEKGQRNWNPLRVTKLNESPEVSNERKITSVSGEWENGAKFEYNFELTHAGLAFWGDAKEPSGTNAPGIMEIRLKAPEVFDATKAQSIQEINDAGGDGALYVDPVDGKTIKFPFNEKWTDIKKKLKKDASYNPIKYAEFRGSPFGDHKIKVSSGSTKTAHFAWDDGYSQVYPIQGAMVFLKSTDGYEAARSLSPKNFKKRLEIKKAERLQVKVIRGAG